MMGGRLQSVSPFEIPTISLAVELHIDRLPPRLSHARIRLASLSEAVEQANIVVVLVDHHAFRCVDPALLSEKIVIDTRGLWR